jgi:plasmid stabilization system protein ParE
MTVRLLEPAEIELAEAFDYYESQSRGLGDRFRAHVRAAVDRIIAHPLAWRRITSNIRKCRVQQFPYAIVYTVEDDAILIVAIMHLARRPGYWRDRI